MGSLLVLLVLMLDVIAIVNVVKSAAPTNQKTLWVILVLALPVIGMVLYFLIGSAGKRSIGVSIIAVLAVASGVLQLVRAAGLLTRGAAQGPLAVAVGVTVALTFGAASIAAGMGCWGLQPWGRRLMIILSVISCAIGALLAAVVALGLGRGLLAGTPMVGAALMVFLVVCWMIYPGFVIWFFRRPSVRVQFTHG